MSYFRILFAIFLCVVISSFALVQIDKEILMQEALTTRIDDYKAELLEKCKSKARVEAELMVDSIIAIELGAGPIDTLDFPSKPSKPNFESFDSLKQNKVDLKPLFDESKIKSSNNNQEDK